MNEILGSKKPENVSESVKVMVESLLLIWFQRFGVDNAKLPVVVSEVLQQSAEILASDTAKGATAFNPMEIVLELSEEEVFERYFHDGRPNTSEKLTSLAVIVVKAGVEAHFTTGEIMDELIDMI